MLVSLVLARPRTTRSGLLHSIKYDHNVANHENKIDTDIATMIEDSYEILRKGEDEITLVAGDSDYVPAIEKLKKRGIHVDVVFWAHAARELKDAGSKFVPLGPYLDYLRRELR